MIEAHYPLRTEAEPTVPENGNEGPRVGRWMPSSRGYNGAPMRSDGVPATHVADDLLRDPGAFFAGGLAA